MFVKLLFFKQSKTAFSLIEVIVAVALFSILAASMITAAVGIRFGTENSEDRLIARYLTQEAQEALRSIRDDDWDNLVESVSTYGFDSSGGSWLLSGTSDIFSSGGKDFTRTLLLTETTQNVRFEGLITISWTTDQGIAQNMVSTMRLTNWRALFWINDSQADFNSGFFNSVQSTTGGSVITSEVASWSTPNEVSFDLAGNGNLNEMTLVENLLYMARSAHSGGQEFIIADMNNITQSSVDIIASFEIGSSMNDVAVSGDHAFVTSDNGNEVWIYDIRDYTFVQSLDLTAGGDGNGIAVTGTDAVVVRDQNSQEELVILDISDPTASIDVSARTVEIDADSFDVAINGNHAFVVTEDNDGEIVVVDLTTDTIVNTVDLTGNANAISIVIDSSTNQAYVGRSGNASSAEFYEIDISSPTTFSEADADTVEIGNNVNDIDVFDGKAYLGVSDTSGELVVLDLATDTIEATINASGNTTGGSVLYEGAHIYGGMAINASELDVFSSGVSAWSAATIPDFYEPGDNMDVYGIFVEGAYAYLARNSRNGCTTSTGRNCEFIILDISDPSDIQYEGALDVSGDANDVYVQGDHAFIATDDNSKEMMVIDVSDPSNPIEVGSYNTSSSNQNGESIYAGNGFALLGTGGSSGSCVVGSGRRCEFHALNTTTLSNPVYADGLEITANLFDIVVDGTLAYVATSNNSGEVYVVDFSALGNLDNPAVYNHGGNADARQLYFDTTDDTLHAVFLTNSSGDEYQILDVGVDGQSFTELGNLETGTGNAGLTLLPSEDLAFIVGLDNDEEFRVVDISNTSSLTQLAALDLDSDAYDVDTDGTNMFIGGPDNSREFFSIIPGNIVVENAQSGIYTTEKFDSGSSSASWGELQWTESGTGSVQFKIKTASTEAGLDLASWVGSDGTPNTFYTTSGSSIVTDPGATGTQFIQVAVYFSGLPTDTISLDDIIVGYNL